MTKRATDGRSLWEKTYDDNDACKRCGTAIVWTPTPGGPPQASCPTCDVTKEGTGPMQDAFNIYQTPMAQKDRKYRAWLTELNYRSLWSAGVPLYGEPAKLRRMYLAGLDTYTAVKKLHGVR